jgi:hypothetical protein
MVIMSLEKNIRIRSANAKDLKDVFPMIDRQKEMEVFGSGGRSCLP